MKERKHKDLMIRFANEPESECCHEYPNGVWVRDNAPSWNDAFRYKVIPPQHKEVFLAWIKGAQVQCYHCHSCGWIDDYDPLFIQECEYRVITPKKHVEYQNMYPEGSHGGKRHLTRKAADQNAASDRIACILVEWEEGQFDE